MTSQKTKVSSESSQPVKLSKSQIRHTPEFARLYKTVHEYSLREEAYATALAAYIQLKKKKTKKIK